MKIGLYKLESPNVANPAIEKLNDDLSNKIVKAGDKKITPVDVTEIDNCNTLFVFVSGGGTETQFKKVLCNYRGKIYLIATTINNSLAASMEILSYLHNKNVSSEIIHGDTETIIHRIKDILAVQHTLAYMHTAKFARIGKPSDWLIASDVDAE